MRTSKKSWDENVKPMAGFSAHCNIWRITNVTVASAPTSGCGSPKRSMRNPAAHEATIVERPLPGGCRGTILRSERCSFAFGRAQDLASDGRDIYLRRIRALIDGRRKDGRVRRSLRRLGFAWRTDTIFGKEWDQPAAIETLMRQNKPKGFMCVSCSWAKPADHHRSNSARMAPRRRCGNLPPDVARPTSSPNIRVTELRNWDDYDLEQQGRLTASVAL